MYCQTSFYQKNLSNESIPLYITNSTSTVTIIGQHPCDPPSIRTGQTYSQISETVLENGILLYFNQINVAHSICQFIISFYEISLITQTPTLYISNCILKMPFLYKLIVLLFNTATIIILENDTLYNCKNVFIPTYIWFLRYGNPTYDVDSTHNVRIFRLLEEVPSSQFRDNTVFFNSKIDEIYINNKSKYKTYDNVCIIKSQLCSDSTTPQRCMILSHGVLDVLMKYQYHMILPHTITDIIEYIVVLKSAKNIISSYGGAQCINRFFYTNANVKVIGNKHYESEYVHPFHNQMTSFKSLTTAFFLDVPNHISEKQMEDIILYSI
jgi:hypothetical protein